MKKRVLFPVLCLSVLLSVVPVLAATSEAEEYYCGICGAYLSRVAIPAGNWTTTHQVPTEFTVDGKTVYETCTVGHTMTTIQKICPNGHGVRWTKDVHSEIHSSTRCRD